MGMIKRLVIFLNILKNFGVKSNIEDVTESSADWDDFWYNEDA
mgnify:CR=1 FL=1